MMNEETNQSLVTSAATRCLATKNRMRALKLIAVSDGRTDDYFWIALDGDGELVEPEALKRAFPDLLGSAFILRDFERSSEVRSAVVRNHLGPATVCIAESEFETRLFTRDPNVYHELLEQLKACLPECSNR
jgi:hypothetical protein